MKRQVLSLPELANKFKSLCDRKGVYMKHVFKEIGMPQYHGKWEKGEGRPPYYHELAQMAEALDVPVEVFIYKDRDPQVHIDKEKFDQLIEAIKGITKMQELDLFDYKKMVG